MKKKTKPEPKPTASTKSNKQAQPAELHPLHIPPVRIQPGELAF